MSMEIMKALESGQSIAELLGRVRALRIQLEEAGTDPSESTVEGALAAGFELIEMRLEGLIPGEKKR